MSEYKLLFSQLKCARECYIYVFNNDFSQMRDFRLKQEGGECKRIREMLEILDNDEF